MRRSIPRCTMLGFDTKSALIFLQSASVSHHRTLGADWPAAEQNIALLGGTRPEMVRAASHLALLKFGVLSLQ